MALELGEASCCIWCCSHALHFSEHLLSPCAMPSACMHMQISHEQQASCCVVYIVSINLSPLATCLPLSLFVSIENDSFGALLLNQGSGCTTYKATSFLFSPPSPPCNSYRIWLSSFALVRRFGRCTFPDACLHLSLFPWPVLASHPRDSMSMPVFAGPLFIVFQGNSLEMYPLGH